MVRPFFDYLTKAIISQHGLAFGIAEIVLALITWQVSGTATVPLLVLVLTLLVTGFLMSFTSIALYSAANDAYHIKPKVKHVHTVSDNLILLLTPSHLLPLDTLATVFISEDSGFERKALLGYVCNVQENKLVQIEILHVFGNNSEEQQQLRAGNSQLLKRLIVKPLVIKPDLVHIFAQG